MREISCPGCGEVLGVPDGLGAGPIRCGVCERIIRADEQDRAEPRHREREDGREDDREERGRFGDDRPRRARRASRAADDRPKKKSSLAIWIWIAVIVGAVILACGGATTFLFLRATDPKLEKFTPPDRRWSAEFPGKPQMEITPIEGDPTKAETSYEAPRIIGRETYMVGYTDYTADELAETTHEQAVTTIVAWLAKSPHKARERSRRDLRMAGAVATEVVMDITVPQQGNGRLIARFLIADNRIFVLYAMKLGTKGAAPEHAERFFNSFQIPAKK